ncbi:class II glutamine amidotransferase [Nakamurella flava]|uniref:Class II glutamine amidotransferase n=1 Tax=Nakamurella flava TaxID=2576308 RepID=A0A4U6Q5X4_9ACTN|nr:class II glutamine amidotransferase [Nakamurella flava]TKV55973.1 class II glutamine amidotransferase [Nakamurella flava]
MCRLFGLHHGHRVTATFWLLDAPDSLREQSRRNPQGAGIGSFDGAGRPVVDKQPIAAWTDAEFAHQARTDRSRTFVAHVRYASAGGLSRPNTHPFVMDGRIFAHNGTLGDLPRLDEELDRRGVRDLVQGQTDSERLFALITAYARDNGGDVGAAITDAVRWVADTLPVFALNIVLATPDELWALRYPDTHDLYLLRPSSDAGHPLHVRSRRISVQAEHHRPQTAAPVVVASERMDSEPGWRLLHPGELVHARGRGDDLQVRTRIAVIEPPRQQLTLADLSPEAAASQRAAAEHGG